MLTNLLAISVLAAWVYLLVGRGGFWLAAERDESALPRPIAWPVVVAVIPARNEAEGVGQCIGSLLAQDYPGSLTIILVDDDSSDATATVARLAAETGGAIDRLTVIPGKPLPSGWTGKLWALAQGIDAAERATDPPAYLLLTDADIVYAPDTLTHLVSKATSGGLVLTSLMAKLRCVSFAEQTLIPAFIFFFQMLYPFAWVNRPTSPTAAAAGGCMLVHADTLRQVGGIGTIRHALIDDCALATTLKALGPIWLGLTERVHSIRGYPRFDDIRKMVARSAYAQLRYSSFFLAFTIVAMSLIYLTSPLLALFGHGTQRWLGLATWGLMALAFQSTLKFYQRSPLWGLALPAITLIYMIFTVDSAWQHARGRGGVWKGRVQARASDLR